MADTGEGREIKERTGAKEAEVVSESKKLLQKSKAAKDKALGRRSRGAKPQRASTNDSGAR